MDMSNATAAGPSKGLLDVIFGSGQETPENALPDGQGFGNLMKLMGILNEKKEAEEGMDAGRTLRETALGKGAAESSAAVTPGVNNNAVILTADIQLADIAKLQEEAEKLKAQRLGLTGLPAAPAVAQAPIQGLVPEQVNEVLRQKGLPALSPQEMKILQDVNSKLAKAVQGEQKGVAIPAEFTVADAILLDPLPLKALPKAPAANFAVLDPQLQKAMAAKGIDPRKIKAEEVSSDAKMGAPDKILTTETYLQMHESMNQQGAKPQAKELDEKGNPQTATAQAGKSPDGSLTAGAVAGTAQKGLGSSSGETAEQTTSGAKQAKLDAAAGGTFNGLLNQKSDSLKKDLYLPEGAKPEQVKSALVAELSTNVSFHAHKGGGEMSIVLHPDDMGEVKLKVGTKNGKVEVQVTADNEDVAKLLRGGSKELESSLRAQNLSLAKFEVSVGDSGSVVATDVKTNLSEQFAQNQQQHHGGFAQASADDGRGGSRWGADQGSHQAGSYTSFAEESNRGSARNARPVPQSMAR
jgi:flagellar hook-length control protein FliK